MLVAVGYNRDMSEFTNDELEAYLDEALAPSEMAAIETAIRSDTELSERLRAILSRRDRGQHSLGGIWRRHRISCPTREQLGSFLLGAMVDQDHLNYIQFHINEVGCRYCRANLEDLKRRTEENASDVATRRKKYFQSSAGYLKGEE